MELTHDDVLEILASVEATDVEYLELEVAGTRIVVDKTGGHAVARATTSVSADDAAPAASTGEMPDRSAVPAPPAASATANEPPKGDVGADDREGLVAIEAPMVGVFYRSPEPGAAPYIERGDRIDATDTVGLVEVMKMFNSITAGVSGEIVEILAENEQFVEYGEPLMLVRPESHA